MCWDGICCARGGCRAGLCLRPWWQAVWFDVCVVSSLAACVAPNWGVASLRRVLCGWPALVGWRFLCVCVPLMVSCSGYGLPLHAQLLRLFVTTLPSTLLLPLVRIITTTNCHSLQPEHHTQYVPTMMLLPNVHSNVSHNRLSTRHYCYASYHYVFVTHHCANCKHIYPPITTAPQHTTASGTIGLHIS